MAPTPTTGSLRFDAKCQLARWFRRLASLTSIFEATGGPNHPSGLLQQYGILLLPEAESGLFGYEDPVRRGVYERKEANAVRRVLMAGDRVIELGAGIGF